MKSQIYASTLIGAIGVVSNTFCVTYLSTYLVPISQGGALPSTKEQSSRPTYQGNTSTQTSLNIDIPDSLTSTASAFLSVDSESSSHDTGLAVSQTGSDNVSFRLTIDALFSDTFTSSSTTIILTSITITSASNIVTSASTAITFDTTTVTEATTTSNSPIVPAGRALGGFVSPADTDICTFASLFNLAQDQLFSNDFPIYYTSGDDYKELVGVDQPSRGSISTGFAASGDSLVFRNTGLPNGEARFCQTSDSRVYVVFTDGPLECVPVTLSVYDSSQCQNGQLVGVGETTISSGTSTSRAVNSGSDASVTVSKKEESTISTETNSSTLTLSSYITQSESADLPITVSKTEESTDYPTTISGTLLPSSHVTESESVGLQTSGTKAPPDVSSRTSESSVLLSSATANAPTLEASTLNTLSATGIDGVSNTESVSTGVASSEMTSQSSLDLSDLSATSTVISETDSTPTTTKTTDSGNTTTKDATFETGSIVDTASTDTTTTEVTTRADTTSKTEAGASTTNTDTTQSGTTELSSSDTTTTEEDTTTIESITTQQTTTELSSSETSTTEEDTTSSNESLTTTDETTTTPQDPTTTTANPSTTTRPYRSCDDLKPRYTIPNANEDKFDIFCTNDVTQGTYSDSSFAWDFQECMDRCADAGFDCRAITYERDISICKLYTSTDGHEFSQDIDYAEKDFCC
ncbi:hypothetical protein FCIRC_8311 [Fusarium circinatum]|uniref:Apple domain-containing protein n=1 Tax=Fusarium circinatum TaxID=48490 RepID=A0A8H5TLX7_FUSCI|nr:hypothetical protein FCIRC_8311 [Fusarium circinatum]